MAYLSFWLAGHLRCFDGSGHPLRLVVAGLPIAISAWIGITRLQVPPPCFSADSFMEWVDICFQPSLGF